MMRFWQAMAFFYAIPMFLNAEEQVKPFIWLPPPVQVSSFSNDLGLLDSEREEYATNLATIGSNLVVEAKASPPSLAAARRMIGLALQLSPRNKKAVVVSFQLAKGMLPTVADSNYSPQVFARLLVTRGQLLDKQGGDENKRLARLFMQLAAELDPKNEDAVYLSEVQRLDHGVIDWKTITDPPEKSPQP